MTENDYIAEYIKERHSGDLSFDFALWKAARMLSEVGKEILKIFQSGEFNQALPEKTESEGINMTNEEVWNDLFDIREALWEADIPSPTVPEYVEHHEQIQSIMKLVEKKMEKYKKGGSGMSKMPKLKPCPFCGRHGDLFQIPENNKEENERHPNWSWRDPGMWLVGCWTPECFGNINHKTMVFISPEDAAEKWNERSDGIV